ACRSVSRTQRNRRELTVATHDAAAGDGPGCHDAFSLLPARRRRQMHTRKRGGAARTSPAAPRTDGASGFGATDPHDQFRKAVPASSFSLISPALGQLAGANQASTRLPYTV